MVGFDILENVFCSWPSLKSIEVSIVKSKIFPLLEQSLSFFSYKHLATIIHTYIHAYIHSYIHTYIHTTFIHIRVHTYIHTYIHTRTYMHWLFRLPGGFSSKVYRLRWGPICCIIAYFKIDHLIIWTLITSFDNLLKINRNHFKVNHIINWKLITGCLNEVYHKLLES